MLEILEFIAISQVITLGEEAIHLHVVPPDQLLQGVAQTDLGRDDVILQEVVNYLEVFQLVHAVRADSELEIEDGRVAIGVLEPASLN